MHLILVGLNHRTAPVALREQLALADCSLRMALDDLGQRCRSEPAGQTDPENNGRYSIPRSPVPVKLTEAVILSTCNRLEIYGVITGGTNTYGSANIEAGSTEVGGLAESEGENKGAEAGFRAIEQFLANLQGIPLAELNPHLYFRQGHEVIIHLMRVAAGLDSMILGEPQILGQVSGAQAEARAAGTTGPLLSHLFERASHAGKRARTETEIGRHTTSISHAAARLVRDKLGDLDRAQLLVVGAGEMAEVAAQALINHGARQLNFINRTYARAEQLARQFEGRALNWYHLPAALAMADVVVTATGAPHIVIHENDVLPILPERGGRPLLFVDIALPRDVEESVGDLEGVQRFDIDHLQSTVDANLAQRRSAIPDVEAIIVAEASSFEEWLKGRQVLPVLVELRRKAREIAEMELARQAHHLNEFTPEARQKVSRMVYRIVNKLLHEPTIRLKASAAEGNGLEFAHVISELFNLDNGPDLPSVPSGEGQPRTSESISE
jgi:glutamyl-tRNA reductase